MKIILITLQLFFIIAMVLFSENALARSEQKTILGGQRTAKWAIPKGFKIKRTFLVQGKETESGTCEFEEDMKMSSAGGIIERVEIEYDPDTCRSLVIEGLSKESQEYLKKRKAKQKIESH